MMMMMWHDDKQCSHGSTLLFADPRLVAGLAPDLSGSTGFACSSHSLSSRVVACSSIQVHRIGAKSGEVQVLTGSLVHVAHWFVGRLAGSTRPSALVDDESSARLISATVQASRK